MSRGILVCGTITIVAGLLFALRAEEKRERLERHRAIAIQHHEHAERARREAEEARAPSTEAQRRDVQKLRIRLERLLAEHREAVQHGFDEVADELQQEIKRTSEELGDNLRRSHVAIDHDRQKPPEERLDHMRAAVEHLRHAGLNEIADRVTEHAEEIERDLDEQRRHHGNGELREAMEQIHDLRQEIQRLREQLQSIEEKR